MSQTDDALTLQEERFREMKEKLVPSKPKEYQKFFSRYPVKDCTKLRETGQLLREMEVILATKTKKHSSPSPITYIKVQRRGKNSKVGEEKKGKLQYDDKDDDDDDDDDRDDDDDDEMKTWIKTALLKK